MSATTVRWSEPVEIEPDFWVAFHLDADGRRVLGDDGEPVYTEIAYAGPSLDTDEPEPVGWPTWRPPTPFRDGVAAHRAAGWTGTIPISRPVGGKGQPLRAGWTGHRGVDPSDAEAARLARQFPGANLALRLPRGVVGIDIDDHQMPDGTWKRGGLTIRARAKAAGVPLPATWKLTSRGPGLSGRHIYRLPPGHEDAVLVSAMPDVETIQHHLRYCLTSPSTNGHDNGRVVQWWDPWGEVSERVPRPDELAVLPPQWVRVLAATPGSTEAVEPVDLAAMWSWWSEAPPGPACEQMISLLARAEPRASRTGHGSRYEATRDHVAGLLVAADHGHRGVLPALARLRQVYVAGQVRSGDNEAKARREFDRLSGLCCAPHGVLSGECRPRGMCPGQRAVAVALARRDPYVARVCDCADNFGQVMDLLRRDDPGALQLAAYARNWPKVIRAVGADDPDLAGDLHELLYGWKDAA